MRSLQLSSVLLNGFAALRRKSFQSRAGSRLLQARALSSSSFIIEGNLHPDTMSVGSKAIVWHTFTQESVNVFAGLCGDDNPLHVNPDFAKDTMFKGTIVHGIFVSSLFSTMLGKSLPGSVYVSQSLAFRRPVHVGAEVSAIVEVTAIDQKSKGKLISMKTSVLLKDGSEAITGEGKVMQLK